MVLVNQMRFPLLKNEMVKINKLNNTEQQYIEHNEAVHARLGLICCLLRHSVSKFYSWQAKIEKWKILTYNMG